MNWGILIDILNATGFIAFVALLGAAGARMLWRLYSYWRMKSRPSIVLRRDFSLLVALFLVFGSAALIRAFGLADELASDGPLRFFYLLAANVIANGALAYWVWAEYFVIGHPGKEDE